MSGDFQAIQHRFTAYLRDPESAPPPDGVELRRLQVYRDLFYNNIAGFLAQGFPVIHQMLQAKSLWHSLVREFFSSHSCDSPYFSDIPGEFVRYVSSVEAAGSPWPAWLAELAHYEWLEMVLDISSDAVDAAALDPEGDLLADVPVLNPVHRLVQYHWPVTTIGVDQEPTQPLSTPISLLLFRDASCRVHFMEINEATWMLLAQLAETTELSGEQQLLKLSGKMPQLDPQQVLHFGAGILADLRARGGILGTAKTPCQQTEQKETTCPH